LKSKYLINDNLTVDLKLLFKLLD